jgi:hypothetical protein
MDSIRQGLQLKKKTEAEAAAATEKPQDLQSILFAGIRRHADLMNGRDQDKPKPQPERNNNAPAGGLSTKLNPNVQKRLAQQSDSDSDGNASDW